MASFQYPNSPPSGKTSMKRLMALETLGPDTFRSITPAFAPRGTTAFGGHVYAQAAYAASKTVLPDLYLHDITGHFILPGRVDTPFTYRVRRIRDGGIYTLRAVSVYQSPPTDPSATVATYPSGAKRASLDRKSPCFIATMSFKRSERANRKYLPLQHQSVPRDHLRRTYKAVLEGKEHWSHPHAPSADAAWYDEMRRRTGGPEPPFPGLDIRKVDMRKYNGVVGKGGDGRVRAWRQLQFYRMIVPAEAGEDMRGEDGRNDAEQTDELALAVSAHLYASDRNSLFLVQRAYGYADRAIPMASLAHTVVFHGGVERLRMTRSTPPPPRKGASGGGGGTDETETDDQHQQPKWFVQEAWTSNAGENRVCHESRLWDWELGEVVASTIQDGMMRVVRTEEDERVGSRDEDGAGSGKVRDEGGGEGKAEAEDAHGHRRAQRAEMEMEEGEQQKKKRTRTRQGKSKL